MKNTSVVARAHRIGCVVVVSSCVVAFQSASAAELKEARVTYVVNDVALLPPQAAPHPAALRDVVRDGTAVRTGTTSRSELTFTDLTITRLGANTIFSFNEGTRNLDLKEGAILLRVPKNAGGAKITTAAVTAAITGTTVMMEYHPHGFIKAVSLEGTFRMYLKKRLGESVLVHAGQMIIMRADATRLPDPVDVDIKQLLKTSLLIVGFPPLPSAGLIAQAVQTQTQEKAAGQLVDTNLVIFGSGTVVSLLDQTNIDQISQAAVAIAAPPSEFGPPSTISSPVPYLITSGTVITTDPTITTNGVTDYGKIWRGTAVDGPLSAFLFGSTSTLDTAIGLDAGAEKVADSGAVFKFTSLELTGNPTVVTTNGQTVLALVGVNGITSGAPGGTLTFAGISTLLLATQDGSINLGPGISFSGLDRLVFYARGAGSNLTLASPVSATIHLNLYAEGSIDVSSVDATLTAERIKLYAGDSITLNGGVMSATAANSSGNVDIFAVNDISVTQGLEIDRKFGGQPSGLNISLTAGGDLTAGNSLTLKVDNSMNSNLAEGANITLDMGGNLTINGGGNLTLIIGNDDGGHIGTGANISVTTGGNLFTQAFTLIVTNFGDVFGTPGTSVGHIGTGGNIFVATGGNLTTDFVNAFIDNRNGASIGSGATISFNIGGALTTHQNAPAGAFFSSEESLFLLISNIFRTASAGTIGSDATISLTAASVSVGGILDAFISNRPAPATIGGSAIINFDVSGNLMVQDYASFTIANEDVFDVGHGGTIKSNATINLSTANISTGELDFFINNRGSLINGTPGGTIGGGATINVNSGNISGDIFAQIDNRRGTIGSDATINVTATNVTANSLFAQINNSDGGTIGGDATINMNVSGKATVTTDDDFVINGSDAARAAAININGGSYDAGGTFLGFIDGNGAITFNNAAVHANALNAGVFGTNGVLRIGGGTLSADSVLKLYAPGSNGQLNFVSNVTLGGNSTKILAANSVTIFNNVVVTIAGQTPVDVYTNNANYSEAFGGNNSTTGTFAGAGANTPQPLASAPPFADPPPPLVTTSKRPTGTAVNVSNTDQLLALLDNAAPGGKITIPSSNRPARLRSSTRASADARMQADRPENRIAPRLLQ